MSSLRLKTSTPIMDRTGMSPAVLAKIEHCGPDDGPIPVLAATVDVSKLSAAQLVEILRIAAGYEQHLCLDKGYDNATGWGACLDADYQPHIALMRDTRPTSQ